MMYACLRYRDYRIKHLKFKNGLLLVDNANDQKLVESNGFYMAHIFPVPEPEEEKSYDKEDEGERNEDGESEDVHPEVAESKPPGKRQNASAAKKGVGRGRKGGVRKGKKEPVREIANDNPGSR